MEHQLDATVTVFIDLQDQLNMFRARFCPKHVELILKINKTVIVASSWCSIFTLPTNYSCLTAFFKIDFGNSKTKVVSLLKKFVTF
jgi:hypothetical protein